MPAPTSAGLLLYRWRAGRAGGAAGAPGRPVLGGQGRACLVDPEGPVRAGRGSAGGGRARVRGGNGPGGRHGEVRRADARAGSRAARSCTRSRSKHDLDPSSIRSNSFSIEWPPRSGRQQSFPEVDRAAWFRWRGPRQAAPRPGRLHRRAGELLAGEGRPCASLAERMRAGVVRERPACKAAIGGSRRRRARVTS